MAMLRDYRGKQQNLLLDQVISLTALSCGLQTVLPTLTSDMGTHESQRTGTHAMEKAEVVSAMAVLST
jgi:hypothetical protein